MERGKKLVANTIFTLQKKKKERERFDSGIEEKNMGIYIPSSKWN